MDTHEEVDLVLLTRGDADIPEAVETGIAQQIGIELHVHRIVGRPLPGDANRWQTIARARNAALTLGGTPWVMFLDDDVVLAPHAVRSLVDELQCRPSLAAVAANYLQEGDRYDPHPHVAMGATLFRRSVLRFIRFRWQANRCECQCCCDDVRRLGLGIAYSRTARATHHRSVPPPEHASCEQPVAQVDVAGGPPRILAAFDRRHVARFRRQFLKSLRAQGNQEEVVAIGYGLYPSEQRLNGLDRVRQVVYPVNGQLPPVRRLLDFQDVLRELPPHTPVAYWDAGDVIFQSSLANLWAEVRRHPDRLLAVREPKGHPENRAVARWTLSIRDGAARRAAFDLLTQRPFLNSGFAAGTARVMLEYLREAHRMLHSAALAGTTDWGDQTALNLYCHMHPERWQEIDEGWNYCVHDREPREVVVRPTGEIVSQRGASIRVAHGNALSLRQFGFLRD
ncbi:MAG: glycosyltransferase family A protein [Pirellulaceae bacterium]